MRFDSGPEVFERVNRNYVLTEYVLNENDCTPCIETVYQRATLKAHLTNFSLEFLHAVFTQHAALHLLHHGAKKSKMTKNSNQGRGPCLKPFQQGVVVHYRIYFYLRHERVTKKMTRIVSNVSLWQTQNNLVRPHTTLSGLSPVRPHHFLSTLVFFSRSTNDVQAPSLFSNRPIKQKDEAGCHGNVLPDQCPSLVE